jgi:hypothetical protein
MRMTVITRDDGEIVGTQRASNATDKTQNQDVHGEVVPMQGQRMYAIDVPDDVVAISDLDELHRRVKTYLPREA